MTADAIAERTDLTIRRLQQMHDFVDALASEYKFKSCFIWHPYVLTGKKVLTVDEKATRDAFNRNLPGVAAAIGETYGRMQSSRMTNFYNLASILDDERETLYIDAGHLLPEGNRIIADSIYTIVRRRMETPPAKSK